MHVLIVRAHVYLHACVLRVHAHICARHAHDDVGVSVRYICALVIRLIRYADPSMTYHRMFLWQQPQYRLLFGYFHPT